MPYPKNSWSILPATDALFNKQKATMEEAMIEMGTIDHISTILIVERDNGNGKTTRFMLSSYGQMDLPIGATHKAHHDQNFRPYGTLRVLDVILYKLAKGDDGKVQVVPEAPLKSPLTLENKFPLFVFK